MAGLNGVYGEGGVYDIPDDELISDEDLLGIESRADEGPPGSFLEAIDQLKSKIDSNIDYIWNFLEGLKLTNPNEYQKYREEYDQLAIDYQLLITQAYEAQKATNTKVQDDILVTLRGLLDYTNEITTNISEQAASEEFPEDSIADEGLPDTSTAMVLHDDVIEMENVGPVREFWDNMSPGMRTIIKALAIGGAIYGGKYVYDRYLKSKSKKSE